MLRFIKKYLDNERGDALLISAIMACLIVSTVGLAVAKINNVAVKGVEASGTAQQAQWLAQARANEVNATSYSNISTMGETRATAATVNGVEYQRETIIGDETTLSSGVTEIPVTINVYKNSETTARVSLSLLPSSAATVKSIPSGVIAMWSGTVATIPDGWLLCNGSNGTPDLRSRFIVGAGADGGTHTAGTGGIGSGYYAPGAAGGEDKHTLTVAEMPSHSHAASVIVGNGDEGYSCAGYSLAYSYTWGTYYLNVSTTSTGGGGAHENRPPYYALAYIMKE